MAYEIKSPKKLIEVALPLDAINAASDREKSIRHGHPSTLHLWWARRPLAAARAVLFSQLVNDPSWNWEMEHPGEIPPGHLKATWAASRKRLFKIIEELVQWKNTTNETVLKRARDEIRKSWIETCELNKNHPEAKKLFNPNKMPGLHDPFAGGGAITLEAQRLGLKAYASDLNPVAVLINKAMIEIPPRFAGMPPVNPESRKKLGGTSGSWKGATGLAEDVRYYGEWMRREAEKRIGHLYPPVEVTAGMANERPDLKQYVGQKLTVIAWIWVRTVRSPNPAFADVEVPLATTWMLSTKKGKEAYVEPVEEGRDYQFEVRLGPPPDRAEARRGTKSGGSGSPFLCMLSGSPMPFEYLRKEAKAERMNSRLMAIVAKGIKGRVYLSPTVTLQQVAGRAQPHWTPESNLPVKALGFRIQEYGMTKWRDLFTLRQLAALTTFSDLVVEARKQIKQDAFAADMSKDPKGIEANGTGAKSYAESISVYLAFAVDKGSDYWSSLCSWHSSKELIRNTFGRQALPMVWDFAEANPFSSSTGNAMSAIGWAEKMIKVSPSIFHAGNAFQHDAQTQSISINKFISTDPPYYDNIGYADLSDYFY